MAGSGGPWGGGGSGGDTRGDNRGDNNRGGRRPGEGPQLGKVVTGIWHRWDPHSVRSGQGDGFSRATLETAPGQGDAPREVPGGGSRPARTLRCRPSPVKPPVMRSVYQSIQYFPWFAGQRA